MRSNIIEKLPEDIRNELTSKFALETPKYKNEYFKWSMKIIYLLNIERDKNTISNDEFMEIYNEMFVGYVNLIVGECPNTMTNPIYQKRMWESLFNEEDEIEI